MLTAEYFFAYLSIYIYYKKITAWKSVTWNYYISFLSSKFH